MTNVINALQMFFIRWLLSPVARVTKYVPQKVWKIANVLAVLGMILVQFAYRAGRLSQFLTMNILFTVFLGIIILAGLKEDMKPVNFSPILVISWLGTAAFTFLTGMLVTRNCLADALLLLVGFPLFFVVWGNRSPAELAKPIVTAVYLAFVFSTVVNFVFFPMENLHYKGMFLNSNALAMFTAVTFVVALIDALSQERFGWRMLIADTVMGLSVMIVLFTNSRAGMYTMVITSVCGILLKLTSKQIGLVKFLLIHLAPAVLAIIIIMSFNTQIVDAGRGIGDYIEKQTVQTQEVKPSKSSQGGKKASAKEKLSLEDVMNYNRTRLGQGQGEDLNSFTTGRVSLWKMYLKEVGFLGNQPHKVLYNEDGEVVTKSSHMTLIQMAYEYGAPAAVFFLIFNILSGVKAVIYVYKNPKEKYGMFSVLIAISYGVYYLVEKLLYPATTFPLMLYILSQPPALICEEKTAKMPAAEMESK